MLNHNLATLKLAYPPVTNREADYVKVEPEVQRMLSDAGQYAIARRPELVFHEVRIDEGDWVIRFSLGSMSDEMREEGALDLNNLPGFQDLLEPTFDIGTVAPDRPSSAQLKVGSDKGPEPLS
jgi:hypothetical protein